MSEEVCSTELITVNAGNLAAVRVKLLRLKANAAALKKFLAAGPNQAIFDGDHVFYELDSPETIGAFIKTLDERMRAFEAPDHRFICG